MSVEYSRWDCRAEMLVKGCRNTRMNDLVVFGAGQANVKIRLERCKNNVTVAQTTVEIWQNRLSQLQA